MPEGGLPVTGISVNDYGSIYFEHSNAVGKASGSLHDCQVDLRQFCEEMLAVFSRILAFCLIVFSMGCQRGQEKPSEVFERFRTALDNGGMEEIGAELSTSTKSHLKGLEAWVYYGKRKDLEKLKRFDLYLILRARMLRESWGEQAWAIAAEGSRSLGSGDVHPLWQPLLIDDFVGDDIEQIDFFDGVAGGQLLVNGRKIRLRLRFRNEGSWKVDIISYFMDSFTREVEKLSGDEYRNLNLVNEVLGSKFGEAFSRELYEPPLAR
ncbi:hypothetical protein MLD52_15810 [Puniceicoccaceae bacterium K14]|nr:hypothetical protein [Puniceicoccaceae bacterium K14]